MEYELIYHTRLYVIFFEITLLGVKATIYNKDVADDQEWIVVAEDKTPHDSLSTDFKLCRELLKSIRKDNNI